MYDSVLIYSRHHAPQQTASLFFCCKVGKVRKGVRAFRKHIWNASMESHVASQRSLHYTPIFRLLLKVAVNGTRQCDFLIFFAGLRSQQFDKVFSSIFGFHIFSAISWRQLDRLRNERMCMQHFFRWTFRFHVVAHEIKTLIRKMQIPSVEFQVSQRMLILAF